jgi:hypothetical protein
MPAFFLVERTPYYYNVFEIVLAELLTYFGINKGRDFEKVCNYLGRYVIGVILFIC